MAGRAADNYLLVRVNDPQRASQTVGEIGALLSKRGVATGAFDVRDPENFVGSQELNTLLLLLRIFAVLGAGLSAFLVANTLTAVMSEETVQIGIVKSLGGRLRHVLLPYLAYSGVLGFIGALAGLGLGTLGGRALSSYLTRLTGLQEAPFRMYSGVVGLAFLVGLLVTVAATLLPATRGARQRVAPLLRSPGVQSERRFAVVHRLTAPLSRLSSTVAVGARNAIRRPARTALTVIVVAIAVASFIATQALSNSVSGTVDDLYALYGADAWISFRRPVDLAFQHELAQSPDVLAVEPWTSASGNVGPVRTDLWGMPAGDTLYDYRLVEGQWFEASNPISVVLTTNLAEALNARVGDQLTLDVVERRESVRVTGIVNDSSTYLGSTATGKLFLPVRDLNRLLGLGERADLFAVRFHHSDEQSVDAALADLEERFADHAPVTLAAYADQESTQNAISVLTLLLRVMVVLVAAVGVAGIANTLLINITERRREYGVLRALGARTVHVVTTLVTEGLAVATLGLIIGFSLGYPLARYLVRLTSAELFELTFYLSGTTLAGAFILALLVVVAVSTMPGLIAARIRPVEVLRYE
jgi:putative ABC transport system permease protein